MLINGVMTAEESLEEAYFFLELPDPMEDKARGVRYVLMIVDDYMIVRNLGNVPVKQK